MLVYKIRRCTDGMFSQGGSWPRFSKTGKIWKQRGHLTSHLGQVSRGNRAYVGCEIVTYELTEVEMGETQSIGQWLGEIEERKRKEKEERQLRREEHQREERRKHFEELKKEFE